MRIRKSSKAHYFEISNTINSFMTWAFVAMVLIVGLIVVFFADRQAYIWLGTEDALGENLTAVFYGIAGLILVTTSTKKIKNGEKLRLEILTILLGLLFIFVAAEEISWGQRFFHFNTPEIIGSSNVQKEFNFHNLKVFDRQSAILNQHTVLNLFALINGVLLPLSYCISKKIKLLLNRINFPIIPLACVPFFFVGIMHGQTIAKLQPHWSHPEIKELVFSMGFLLFSFSVYYGKNRLPDS